jgi:hypothetical protein
MKGNIGSGRFIGYRLLTVFLIVFWTALPLAGMMNGPRSNDERAEGKKNQLMVLPILYYTPETKIAGGAGGIFYWRALEDRLNNRTSTFFMDLVYTQKNQIIFEIIPDLYLKKGRFNLVGYLGFKKYVEKFYGIGSHTSDDMEEDFNYRSLKLRFSLRKKIGKSFYGGIQYDFETSKIVEVEPGGILDSEDILGSGGSTVSGLGIVLLLDSRNNIFFPTRGTLFQIQASFFSQAFGSDYDFQKINFDFRQYVPLFSKHVLAFQENVNLTLGEVPFQWMSFLGGPSVLRGHIQGRFRDKHSIFLQMEYRLPLVWRLSAAGFVGYGDVAGRLDRFRLNDFKVAGGFGIRFRVNRQSGTNVRLDFGFAKGNFGVYAMINEAF